MSVRPRKRCGRKTHANEEANEAETQVNEGANGDDAQMLTSNHRVAGLDGAEARDCGERKSMMRPLNEDARVPLRPAMITNTTKDWRPE
jgi:hypothetical protein